MEKTVNDQEVAPRSLASEAISEIGQIPINEFAEKAIKSGAKIDLEYLNRALKENGITGEDPLLFVIEKSQLVFNAAIKKDMAELSTKEQFLEFTSQLRKMIRDFEETQIEPGMGMFDHFDENIYNLERQLHQFKIEKQAIIYSKVNDNDETRDPEVLKEAVDFLKNAFKLEIILCFEDLDKDFDLSSLGLKITQIRELIDKIEKSQLDTELLFDFGQKKIQILQSKISELKNLNRSLFKN
jgi:hypothetical protein